MLALLVRIGVLFFIGYFFVLPLLRGGHAHVRALFWWMYP